MASMAEDRFSYQSQKLSLARSSLMDLHPLEEAESYASAFDSCTDAFADFDVEQVKDENVKRQIETIKRLMDTTGIAAQTGEGTRLHRARAMTQDEKREFSRAVDELASWFHRGFWTSD